MTVDQVLLVSVFVLSPVVAAALVFIVAPYGRHVRAGWGPMIPARAGWILMELPSLVVFLVAGGWRAPVPAALWCLHYGHRALIYPFRARGRPMPIAIVAMGASFNLVNGWLNGRAVGDVWLWAGAAVFLVGFATNFHADTVLMGLRRPGQQGYTIPEGGLYRWVSCPNYLGELVEWCGWALLTGTWAGLAFAVFTAANLAPRALANHRWYQATFPDYPRARRALIPWLW